MGKIIKKFGLHLIFVKVTAKYLSLSQQHLKRIKTKLCPSATCWSTSSDLYVGCKEGFLLCVNPDTLLVSVLYKPQTDVTSTGKLILDTYQIRTLLISLLTFL